MNESLFTAQLLVILIFLGIAVRWGRWALTALIALSGVLANLFVLKQMDLFGLQVTCSDLFAIGGILGLNLIQELYGRSAAQEAIRASLLTLVLFACMAQLHLLFVPSVLDRTQGAYEAILSSTPRIVLASIGSYYIVQRCDVILFSKLKRLISPFSVRVLISLFFSQALDTVLFSFFGLYGLVSSLFDIIFMSFIVKCTLIACSSPLAAFLKRFTKQESEREQVST